MLLVFATLLLGAAASDGLLPVILEGPVNITNGVGSTVTFQCSGEGSPTPNAMIVKEDTISDYNMYNAGGSGLGNQESKVMVERTIKNLAHTDEGWYVCIVSNQHGVTFHRAYLEVVGDLCRGVRCPRRKVCTANYETLTAECRCRPCEDPVYQPVCASDCQSYYNPCHMKTHACENGLQLEVVSEGECQIEELQISVPDVVKVVEGDSLSLSAKTTGFPAAADLRWVKMRKNGKQKLASEDDVHAVQSVSELDAGIYKVVARQCNNKIESAYVKVVVEPKEDNAIDDPVPDQRVCKVFGDPHVSTFDGKNYDFMGRCDYIIAMDASAHEWMLAGRFMPCGNGVTCLEQVMLHHDRSKPVLTLTRGWIVAQNGEKYRIKKNKPVELDGVMITYNGLDLIVEMKNGVKVMFDGFWGVQVIVGEGVQTMGLCGNNNGQSEDDTYRGRFGFTGDDTNKFGTSWGYRYNWCGIEEPTEEVTCDNQAEIEEKCDNILESESFSECAAFIGTQFYRDSCIVDGCTTVVDRFNGDPTCAYANSIAQHCRVAGFNVPKNFLQEIGCGAKRKFQQAVYEAGCPYQGDPPFLDAE